MTAAVPALPKRGTPFLLALLVLVALGGYISLFRHAIVDDAFISMRYSAMLAERGEWTFLPGRISNTATSPLNVLTTAAVGRVLGDIPLAALTLATLHFAAMLLLLLRISQRLFGSAVFGTMAFVALATNCLLLSTLGLEGTLFTVLFIWSIERSLADDWTRVAIACGLVVLARPDGGLLAVLYLLTMPGGLRARVRFVLTAAVTVSPWFLYSWIHLGSLVPDTLQIKVSQSGWGRGLTYATGLGLYLQRYPLQSVWSFLLLPCVPFAFVGTGSAVRRTASIVGAYGVLHLAAYTAMGIPPYHWYYVNQVVPVALVGSLGATALAGRVREGVARRGVTAALVALPALGLLITFTRVGVPLREAPIHTNWWNREGYRQVGLWLREHVAEGDVIFNVSEMGTVGFYAERMLVNEFSDQNITWGAIVERYPSLPWPARVGIDLNYYWRRMQPPLPPRTYTLIHLKDDESPGNPLRVVNSWETSTSWTPHARLYLLRAAAPERARP